MHLALRLFVLCAAACAAVDAAVPQSGASFPVVYPESGTSQAAVKEDGVYSLAGQFRPLKKGVLTGRMSVLSALGMLVGVSSAAVLSFLLWKCLVGSRGEGSRVSPSRRPADEPADEIPTVRLLHELKPEDLRKKAADMLKQAKEQHEAEGKKLEERQNKLDAAGTARDRLESALQRREDLSEDSSAEAFRAADAAVEEARASLKTLLVELGADLRNFSRLEDRFLRGVKVWLRRQREEREPTESFRKQLHKKWRKVDRSLDSLEKQHAALAQVAPQGAQVETRSVRTERHKLELRASELRSALYSALEFEHRETVRSRFDYSFYYFATDEETDNDSDVERVSVELPGMTVDELDEAVASSLDEAQARLKAEAEQLKEREKALNLKELDIVYGKLHDLTFTYDTAKGEKKKRAREEFDKQRKIAEPLLRRVLGGQPIPEVDRLKVPGIFSNYFRSCYCTVERNISAARGHHGRRQRTWERVRSAHESFRKLKQKVADLEARERTVREEAQLQSFRMRLDEAATELHELLKTAKKKDAIPLEEKQLKEPITEEDYENLTKPIDPSKMVGL